MPQSQQAEYHPKAEIHLVNAYTQGSFTMIPLRSVVFLRRFLPWQLFRFMMINIRMTVMILKSHK